MPSIDLSAYQPKQKKRVTHRKQQSSMGWKELLHKDITFGNGGFSDKKKEAFYLEISTLLLSGIDMKTALELILVEQEKSKDKFIYDEIKKKVLYGNSLSEALKAVNKFSDYEYYSVRIGEETGKLAEVLKELAQFFKDKISQRRKVISAITYPIIVLATSMGAVFFMLKFVVPMFADVFLRFGGDLPWITYVIIRLSKFLDASFLFLFLFLIGFLIFLYRKRHTDWFRKWSAKILLKIPVVGEIVSKVYLARFANTMRLLVSTNTPLLKSIGMVRQMISFYPIEQSLFKVEKDILHGESLHQSLSEYEFYPSKFIQLIKVGEEVNRLDYFFDKIAVQYTEEVEFKTSTISSVLEPLIIIFLGLVVGLILIAMYLPMFQMSNNF
jgi:type IV pilus assembly protein PilC